MLGRVFMSFGGGADLAQRRGDTLHVRRTCKWEVAAASQWGAESQVGILPCQGGLGRFKPRALPLS